MIIKLTNWKGEDILIGTESIIDARPHQMKPSNGNPPIDCTKIQSRGAMVETNYVIESIEEIYNLINLNPASRPFSC
jgi:hypothetical protein